MTKKTVSLPASVLIVDDAQASLSSLCRLIRTPRFQVRMAKNDLEGLTVLKQDSIQIVIISHRSSHMGAAGFIHRARPFAPDTAFLVLGPLNSFLYLSKEVFRFSGGDLTRNICPVLESIMDRISACQALSQGPVLPPKEAFGPMIGKSRAMNRIYQVIENLKASSATVLIQGESGTGKELVARTLHQTSTRKDQPFVAVNCGAIPRNLVESQLFGHERGAFTTALSQHKGKFEQAGCGTLFLDEIAELDRDIQVKLLRVLQERQFERVGGTAPMETRARIISASNVDLKTAMDHGRFRQDLFYRLNVVPLTLPPLRERQEDIGLLLDHLFSEHAKGMNRSCPMICQDARDALHRYGYPGNVREMANIVERILVTCPGQTITLGDLPPEVRRAAQGPGYLSNVIRELPDKGIPLKTVERELILKTLEKTRGNKQEAARTLGITRRLLYLRLAEYEDGARA